MGAAAPERTGASLDGWLDQSVVAPAFRIRELKGSVGAGDLVGEGWAAEDWVAGDLGAGEGLGVADSEAEVEEVEADLVEEGLVVAVE